MTRAYLNHAAFAAYADNRSKTDIIGMNYLNETLPKVIFSGGGNGLSVEVSISAGYETGINKTDLLNYTTSETANLAGLFGYGYMPYRSLRSESDPSLSEMIIKALEILGMSGEPFFLIVEYARIDHAFHDNNLVFAQGEVLELHEAVSEALA